MIRMTQKEKEIKVQQLEELTKNGEEYTYLQLSLLLSLKQQEVGKIKKLLKLKKDSEKPIS